MDKWSQARLGLRLCPKLSGRLGIYISIFLDIYFFWLETFSYMIYIPKVWKGDYKETLWRREGNSGPTTLHNRRQLLFLVQCSATALSSCWKFPFSSHEKVDGMGWGWHTLNIVNPTYWCFQRDTIEENLNAQEAAELSTVLRRLVSFSHSVS
jgi:hypothetical protein